MDLRGLNGEAIAYIQVIDNSESPDRASNWERKKRPKQHGPGCPDAHD